MNLQQFKLELEIGWRYVRAARKYGKKTASGLNSNAGNPFVSFISLLSMMGIALGVAALIVVMSVMNGFQKEVRARMLGVISHIEIMGANGGMPDWQTIAAKTALNPQVVGTAPYVLGQGMVVRGEQMKGVVIRGVAPDLEPKVSDLAALSKGGKLADLQAGTFGVMLGGELARSLGVQTGDAVNVIVPSGAASPIGVLPRTRKLSVVGVFESGHYEYDASIALMHLDDAAKLLQIDTATGVRAKIKHMDDAPQVAREINTALTAAGADVFVRDWSRANRTWFAAVQVEKRMMFIILTLIIAVAAFNLVSMLVMTVTEKHGQIAILRTLGAGPASIRRIFMIQGFTVGASGLLAGLLLGVLLALNLGSIVGAIESLFGVQFLPKDIYFISELPSDLQLGDVAWVALIALALALLSTIYPSSRAAKINPAEALRYE